MKFKWRLQRILFFSFCFYISFLLFNFRKKPVKLENNITELACPLTLILEKRYQPILQSSHHYLFAISLHNSEAILPFMARELIQLHQFLKSRFHISMYQGGSKDQTVEEMKHLEWYFKLHQVNATVDYHGDTIAWNSVDRIPTMAQLRNKVLSPLYQDVHSYKQSNLKKTNSKSFQRKYNRIVFLNDIVFCAADILELMLQHEIQQAHMTCPLDFMDFWGEMSFYDAWVARTLAGDLLYNAFPKKLGTFDWSQGLDLFWKDEIGKQRAQKGWPVQVLSCWNGGVVMNAQPFYKDSLQFRGAKDSECQESECWFIAKDFWDKGYGKIMIVPNVAVAYNLKDFRQVHTHWEDLEDYQDDVAPFFKSKLKTHCSKENKDCQELSKTISWKSMPDQSICFPLEKKGRYEANWKNPIWKNLT